MITLQTLTGIQLLENLKRLTGIERETIATIVQYLHEVEKRNICQELGYNSLFALCRALGYSEGAAYRRIQAARCLDKNPEIVGKLSSGALSLCAVGELSRVPAHERAELIAASEGKSKFEVQKLVATKVPLKKANAEKVTVFAIETPLFAPSEAKTISPTERRYTVTLELTEEEYNLLEEVQVITSERMQSRAVVRALKVYKELKSPIEKRKRREKRSLKTGKKTVPHNGSAATVKVAPAKVITRHIASNIRDQVIIRDECQCTFETNGYRCAEKTGLHIDHVMPYSIGGRHEIDNLRLLCRAHNQYVYDRFVSRRSDGVLSQQEL